MDVENGAVPRTATEEPAGIKASDILSGTYGRAVDEYRARGWDNVFPLPFNKKNPPPDGVTGKFGKTPTDEQIVEWKNTRGNGNVGIGLAADEIAIDIDAYKHPDALQTLKEKEEKWGPLPKAWSITSRLDGSRKLVFRTSGSKFPGSLAGIGEIVQRHHRYCVTWPSTNPDDDGHVVFWYTPDGDQYEGVPDRETVRSVVLPERWERELAKLATDRDGGAGEGSGELSGISDYTGLMQAAIKRVTDHVEGRYDSGLWLAQQLRDNGCGARDAEPFLIQFRGSDIYTYEELETTAEYKDTIVKWLQMWNYPARDPLPAFTTKAPSGTLIDWVKRVSSTLSGDEVDEVNEVEEPFILSSSEVRNRPKLKWQIDGMMPERSLWQAFGPTGSYKTFVIIDMINQLANGPAGNFLGHEILTDGPGLCCMILGEGGGDIAERQEAWCLAHLELTDENTFFVIDKDINLLNVDDVNRLGQELLQVSVARGLPWRCIVFDTQADHLPTGDERNESTFSELKPKLLHISRQLNTSVGLVHHTGHNEDRERGSSRQRQMLDVVMNIDGSKIVAEKVKAGPKFADIPYITRSIGDSLVVAQPTDMEVVHKAHQKIQRDAVALVAYMEKMQAPNYILDDLKKGLNWGRPRVLAAAELAHEFIKVEKSGRSYTFTLATTDD